MPQKYHSEDGIKDTKGKLECEFNNMQTIEQWMQSLLSIFAENIKVLMRIHLKCLGFKQTDLTNQLVIVTEQTEV